MSMDPQMMAQMLMMQGGQQGTQPAQGGQVTPNMGAANAMQAIQHMILMRQLMQPKQPPYKTPQTPNADAATTMGVGLPDVPSQMGPVLLRPLQMEQVDSI